MGLEDAEFLREVFDTLLPDLDGRQFTSRALHGEPHDGNRLVTPFGIRWIDLESVCRGPVEWDLAFLPALARESFADVDDDLLGLLTSLNSARVATWCWIQARFPEMRWHVELVSSSEASDNRGQLAQGEQTDLLRELEDRGESLIATFGRQRSERARQRAGSIRDTQDRLAQPHVPVAAGKDGLAGVHQCCWRFAA